MADLPRPKYKWIDRTEVTPIYQGYDLANRRQIGRVSAHHSGWHWNWYMSFAHWISPWDGLGTFSGTADSARAAALAAEQCYDDVLSLKHFGMTSEILDRAIRAHSEQLGRAGPDPGRLGL
jgi:hypothetical protein